MSAPNETPWLSAPELALHANISETTARRWIRRYGLGRKIGGRWRADPTQVMQFIEKGDGGPAATPPRELDGQDHDEGGEQ